MSDFIWTKELTEFAKKSLEHSSWAYINPSDILRTVDRMHQSGGKVSRSEIDQIREDLRLKTEDFWQSAKYLELITIGSDESMQLTDAPSRPGFYCGRELSRIIEDESITSSQALSMLGHNFIMHARESLPFCCSLMDPGSPKDYLKQAFENHYVFNQKLNEFKFQNLIKNLISFNIIKECEYGLVIEHAPSALTFYKITSEYLFLALNAVGRQVDASDLRREVNNLLPNREEDYTVLGFERFPLEGWEKHRTWLTPESFAQMLRVGLVEPKSVARILKFIARDTQNETRHLAQKTLRELKNYILEDAEKFKGEPINFAEILQEYDEPATTFRED